MTEKINYCQYGLVQYGTFPIDDELLPVLRELNHLGLRTISSCSGHLTPIDAVQKDSMPYIMFQVPGMFVREDHVKGTITIYWDRFNRQGLQSSGVMEKYIEDTKKELGG